MTKKHYPRVLVTGGAGFIGSHIVEYLLDQGEPVRILDNFSTGKQENLLPFFKKGKPLEVIEGDISDFETVLSAMKGIKYVFHDAALVSVCLSIQNPRASFQNNMLGTFNIFEAARRLKVSLIVFASSAAVYGTNSTSKPLREETMCMPMSPYALEKMYAEKLAALYYRIYGVSSVGLRYFNVYGPRQDMFSSYSGVISTLVRLLRDGQRPFIYGSGEQTRDFVYIKDVVNANIRSLEIKQDGHHIFNVGKGKSISINQLFEILKNMIGIDVLPIYSSPREGDVKYSCANTSLIQKYLGWKYKWEIEEGLSEFLEECTVMELNSKREKYVENG